MTKDEWYAAAQVAFRRYTVLLRNSGIKRFRFEQFREYMTENSFLEPPPHHNHWGSIGRWARKQGLVRETGKFIPAKSPATHKHPVHILEVC